MKRKRFTEQQIIHCPAGAGEPELWLSAPKRNAASGRSRRDPKAHVSALHRAWLTGWYEEAAYFPGGIASRLRCPIGRCKDGHWTLQATSWLTAAGFVC